MKKKSKKAKKAKFLIQVAKKSKLSSSDWRELSKMLRAIQAQEREWLDELEEKQTKCAFAGTIWADMTLKEVKSCFKDINLLLLAREDNASQKIIGFCAVEKKPGVWWATCSWLFVSEEWRHHGVASGLLELAFSEVDAAGLESLELRVSVKNKAAQALYKKLGFSTTAWQMEKWVA